MTEWGAESCSTLKLISWLYKSNLQWVRHVERLLGDRWPSDRETCVCRPVTGWKCPRWQLHQRQNLLVKWCNAILCLRLEGRENGRVNTYLEVPIKALLFDYTHGCACMCGTVCVASAAVLFSSSAAISTMACTSMCAAGRWKALWSGLFWDFLVRLNIFSKMWAILWSGFSFWVSFKHLCLLWSV